MSEYIRKKFVVSAHQWNPRDSEESFPEWLKDGISRGIVKINDGEMSVDCGNGERIIIPGNFIVLAPSGKFYASRRETMEYQYEKHNPLNHSMIDDRQDGLLIVVNTENGDTRISVSGPDSVMVMGRIIDAIE